MALPHNYFEKLKNDPCNKFASDTWAGMPPKAETTDERQYRLYSESVKEVETALQPKTEERLPGMHPNNLGSEIKVTNVSGYPGFKPTNDLTEATKFDKGKVRAGLVLNNIPNALLAVSEVGTMGAAKYAPNNWKGLPIERLEDALQRHLLAHYLGEVNDAESGLTHLAHAVWNLLAILELTLLEDKKKQNGVP